MIQAFLAYLLWGAFPLYFPLLQPAGPVEILAHRFVWTLVVMAVILLVMRKWRELREASRRTWGIVAAAAFFIAVNWGVYVYAVNSGHIAEAALGYFINPLVSVLLGVIFLKERLSVLQKWSVGIAAIAVIVLTIGVGRPPGHRPAAGVQLRLLWADEEARRPLRHRLADGGVGDHDAAGHRLPRLPRRAGHRHLHRARARARAAPGVRGLCDGRAPSPVRHRR